MPRLSPKQCPTPGCTRVIEGTARCCSSCEAKRPKPFERLHARDRDRPNAAARGYDYEWQQRRERILSRDKWCRSCKRKRSAHVDHIVAKKHGGSDDDSNLQGLCRSCHNLKTRRGQ